MEKSIIKKEINLADEFSQSSGQKMTKETFDNQLESFENIVLFRRKLNKIQLLKSQVQDSLKLGMFDMKKIRNLENEAAKVI
mmetsp:Transcript_15796/g.15236  ORF Transcript_15796/g.15236 Transcript_15796/m.15236 type:complete len:82 (+) Transcript_15796:1010-1255(+)